MNDFDPSLDTAPPGPTSRERLEAALSAIVDQYGPSLFFEPDRLKAYLDAACPDTPKGISLILLALAEEVPQQLLAAHSDNDLATLLPRLVNRLIERSMFEQKSATWVVRAWTHALALPATGLDGAKRAVRDPPATVRYEVRYVDFAAVVTPVSDKKAATSQQPPVVQPPVVAPVQPEATPPAMDLVAHAPGEAASTGNPAAPSMEIEPPAPREEIPAPPAEATPPTTAIASHAPLEDTLPVTPEPVAIEVDASATSASLAAPLEPAAPSVDHARGEPVTAAAVLSEPAAEAHAPLPPAEPDNPEPIVGAPPVVEPIVVSPPVAPVRVRAPSVVRAAKTPVVPAGVLVPLPRERSPRRRSIAIGVAVLVAVVAVIALNRKEPSPSAGSGTTSVARGDTPVASPPPPGAASPAMPDRPATTSAATAAERAPQDVALTAPDKTVDATSGKGSPPLVAVSQPQSAVVELPAAPAPPPTPEAPATKSKVTTPVATIARIDVPRAAPGRALVLALHVDQAGSGDLATVEHKPVDGSAPTRSTPVSSLERSRSGALLYPVDAADRASGTLQFTLVDRQGRRGPSRRVALGADTAAPLASAADCKRTTCGSVVAVREAGKSYETIIRMDDRTIHTVTEPSRWRPGARVRMNGTQFVLVAAARR